jgi:hypothetical protein
MLFGGMAVIVDAIGVIISFILGIFSKLLGANRGASIII